jgi:hypothetical protein
MGELNEGLGLSVEIDHVIVALEPLVGREELSQLVEKLHASDFEAKTTGMLIKHLYIHIQILARVNLYD